MAQFDIYKNPKAGREPHIPFVVDVQHEFLGQTFVRLVVPLYREAAFGPRMSKLHPVIVVGRARCVFSTNEAGALPVSKLRDAVGNALDQRSELLDAMDFLLRGF